MGSVRLTLALLMARVLAANDAHNTLAADDLAAVTDSLYRGFDFHDCASVIHCAAHCFPRKSGAHVALMI
jgi:hypothetical protein